VRCHSTRSSTNQRAAFANAGLPRWGAAPSGPKSQKWEEDDLCTVCRGIGLRGPRGDDAVFEH